VATAPLPLAQSAALDYFPTGPFAGCGRSFGAASWRNTIGSGAGGRLMLFNSYEFIFLFLPAAVVLHFSLARHSIGAATVGTAISSLVFYAWWNPPFILLPIISIAANFWLARRIADADAINSRRLLIAGIVGNLLVLCYYKYTDFLLSIIDDHVAIPPRVPLALSFTTFVQIAFLVYVHQRRIKLHFDRYALFVAFFPHLIAGPVVRWGSLGRQIDDPSRYRVNWENIALGLTIFTFGLAKKALIADTLSPHVAGVFDAAARGEPLMAAAAWGGVLAFTVQIFFDFSGYSDMAIGLGLLFNFRLPINFAAPLRSTNMFDLWRRWHVTVCRMARDLIYVPIARAHPSTLGRNVALATTMMVLGIWHGAGWTFVVWGIYNVMALFINQAWWALRPQRRSGAAGRLVGWALTFTTFVIGAAFFRAVNLSTSWHLLTALAGFGDATVPDAITSSLDDWGIEHGYFSEDFIRSWFGTTWTMVGTLSTAAALAVALLVPDTMEIVDYREGDAQSDWRRSIGFLGWYPSPIALALVTGLFAASFLELNHASEFLYYQF
jgi:D-alanyl-lipoteichoic acid acyltransferase DltB (MBOAT superfamily)